MGTSAISVEDLSKAYRIGVREEGEGSWRSTVARALKAPWRNLRNLARLDTSSAQDLDDLDILWALKGVTFDVAEGEVVGIIGRNGAGKSTLLKILSKITEPTGGRATIRGRVSSLLEVGTGFHPELTGRENVYLNGTVLGMKKTEIDRKFDEIVEFSGVERFLDTPIKRYSSGMKVRLAFAVAAHLEPEILIIDEVLAVGDAEFQRKCLRKMDAVAMGGRTVLFVSHNMGAIRQLCGRCVFLKGGMVDAAGDTEDIVERYLTAVMGDEQGSFKITGSERKGLGGVKFTDVRMVAQSGQSTVFATAGLPYTFEFDYENPRRIRNAHFAMTIWSEAGLGISQFSTQLLDCEVRDLAEAGSVQFSLARLPLPPGRYRTSAQVLGDEGVHDQVPRSFVFDVVDSVFFSRGRIPPTRSCTVLLDHEFRHLRPSGGENGVRSEP